jgi:hypothetical protein
MIMLGEMTVELINDESSLWIHDSQAVLAAGEVIMCERWGKIQIDCTHK